MSESMTRREALRAGALGGAGLATWSLFSNRLVERAFAASSACGSLGDIEHIVILIQENRSFDHYFGTYRGARGFGDRRALRLRDGSGLSVLAQPGWPGGIMPDAKGVGHLYPYHLDPSAGAECTPDIDHSWGGQHAAWNNGRMDRILAEKIAANGPVVGPTTMGYYTREDLPFFHALADAFTLCDGYHCSALGPTDPNRLYTMTATIDPDGKNGGPLLSTLTSGRVQEYGKLTWKTFPEVLQDAGVSWKVYESPENIGPESDNVLPYFKPYMSDPTLAARAFGNSFPGSFQADCTAGTLPQVSWILGPVLSSEHPPQPTDIGEYVSSVVLQSLLANPAVWEKTVLLVTYDENGGYFDHVPPPTAPPGTLGEYITAPGAADPHNPIGLGFRVPMLVVSPFARGGFICSETFDHTSMLKLIAARFGLEVPNLSRWRDRTVGDMTSAFNFARVDTTVPAAVASPPPASDLNNMSGADCLADGYAANSQASPSYPVTVNHRGPSQEPGRPRRPSGPVRCRPQRAPKST